MAASKQDISRKKSIEEIDNNRDIITNENGKQKNPTTQQNPMRIYEKQNAKEKHPRQNLHDHTWKTVNGVMTLALCVKTPTKPDDQHKWNSTNGINV